MQIDPLPDDDRRMPELLLNKTGGGGESYSSGPHTQITQLVTDIAMESNELRNYARDDASRLRMALGFIWEDMVGDYLSEYLGSITQVPVYFMGLAGRMDAVNSSDGMIEEFKATWASSQITLARSSKRWLRQLACFCFMWDAVTHQYADKFNGFYPGKLRVLYMCPSPRMRNYQVVFSKDEVVKAWDDVYNLSTNQKIGN